MSDQKTSTDTRKHISSVASAVGHSHLDSLDGRQLRLHGPAPAPASPTRQPAKDSETQTQGTSGRSSCGSSASASLQSCLESRLRANLGANGSPEYALTWKHWDMPSGPPICALRASARRTSGKGYSGWPTPDANAGERFGQNPDRINRQRSFTINDAARTTEHLTGWPTASARDWKDGRASQETMNRNSRPLNEQVVHGLTPDSSTAETAKPAASPTLNPAFSRWLMAFPETWDAASPNWLAWSRVQELIASAV